MTEANHHTNAHLIQINKDQNTICQNNKLKINQDAFLSLTNAKYETGISVEIKQLKTINIFCQFVIMLI